MPLINIALVIFAVLLPYSVCFAFSIIRKDNKKRIKHFTDKHFIISLSPMVMHIGFIMIGITLIMLFAFTLTSDEPLHWLFYMFMGLFLAYGLFLVFITITFRIDVNGEMVSVNPLLRKPYSFMFNEIILAERKIVNSTIRHEFVTLQILGKKKLTVEDHEISYKRFLKKLQNELPGERLVGFGTGDGSAC